MAACEEASLVAELDSLSLTPSMRQTTCSVTVLTSLHGQERRAQRAILKRDLQAAVKYGKREPSYNQRGELNYKFRFADIVYITDHTCKKEITSWATPGAGLDVEKMHVTPSMQQVHDNAVCLTHCRSGGWTSHTVIVVDQSGSMRKTDVQGGASRSDSVWVTLALEFVAKQLNNGTSTPLDVVSVIVMNQESSIVVDRQPMNWLLFNRIIDLLRTQEPSFDGNYRPALDLAERLLLKNNEGSCALTLLFLSDGKPSDRVPPAVPGSYRSTRTYYHDMVSVGIDSLASRFGRRLTVLAVGFGGASEEFSVLNTLASRPAQFGSVGVFHAASLTASALGTVFSSLVTSLTATKTELTELGGSSQRAVRDVKREPSGTLDDLTLNENWYLYEKGDFVSREAWSFEDKCWKVQPFHSIQAKGVAYRKKYFGEGAERIVAKFREVDSVGNFVGPLLVSKESRFQSDARYSDQKAFHKVFCQTQGTAKLLAEEFNKKLSSIPGVSSLTPRIEFIDCSVYTVRDTGLGEIGVSAKPPPPSRLELQPFLLRRARSLRAFICSPQ